MNKNTSYIGKTLKTLRPLYFDYDRESVETDSPKNMYGDCYHCGRDYGVVRTGALLTVVPYKEYMERIHGRGGVDEYNEEDGIVAVHEASGHYLIFTEQNPIELKMDVWFEEKTTNGKR